MVPVLRAVGPAKDVAAIREQDERETGASFSQLAEKSERASELTNIRAQIPMHTAYVGTGVRNTRGWW